jgi:hypothetical protein
MIKFFQNLLKFFKPKKYPYPKLLLDVDAKYKAPLGVASLKKIAEESHLRRL